MTKQEIITTSGEDMMACEGINTAVVVAPAGELYEDFGITPTTAAKSARNSSM